MSQTICTTSLALGATLPPSLSEPNVSAVLRFHHHDDGYISFHGKPNGKFTDYGAWLPAELEELFPELRAKLERDSYFSINAFGIRKRGMEYARYLTSCYLDLDCYDLSPDEVWAKTIQAIAENIIPSPSLFALSGNGYWVFWLLQDGAEPDLPARAYPEKRLLHVRIQRSLHARLKKAWPELRPDAAAIDVSRITRIPGSLNTKNNANVHVQHVPIQAPDGKLRFYTLPELASFLGLEERKRAPKKIVHTGRRIPNNLAGWIARWAKALECFETLRDLRGGFAKGCRNNAIWVYVYLLRQNRIQEHEVFRRVLELASEAVPPLPEVEAVGVLGGQPPSLEYHMSIRTMLDKLNATPQETEALARFIPEPRAERENRNEARMTARRNRIREIVADFGEVPPAAAISRVLQAENFPGASSRTVARDLEALGFASSRKRRPRTKEKQPRLPELEVPEFDFSEFQVDMDIEFNVPPPFEFNMDVPELEITPEWAFLAA